MASASPWRCRSMCSLDMFDGHHFFLVQHESAVLRCVRRYADEHLTRWRIGAARQLAAG